MNNASSNIARSADTGNTFRVEHTTAYQYTEAVSLCHNRAALTPRNTPDQTRLAFSLDIQPRPESFSLHDDYFGNEVSFFSVESPHQRLSVTARSLVVRHPRKLPPPQQSTPWPSVATEVAQRCDPEALSARAFVLDSTFAPARPELARFARSAGFGRETPILTALIELNRRIYRAFTYDPSATTIATSLEELIDDQRGVCQDYAHFMLGCVRALSLPGRYVSGYLRSAPGRQGAEASHAWVSVYCGPELGWVDLDPTNDLLPAAEHITLAWGRDFEDVSPLKGVILGGGGHSVTVSVGVVPVEEESAEPTHTEPKPDLG
jgi:transglutaminase-like putative cysteine protease